MSTFAPREVLCPCGHVQSAQLADGLHISRMPHVRQMILDGTFHNVWCAGCGQVRICHTKTLYTDFERHHWVAVAPPWLVDGWAQWVEVMEHEFDHNMRRAAPPMIQALAERFKRRLCFGFDALAEKLRAWDAGLDDRLVEVLKLQLIDQHRQKALAPGSVLRLIEVDKEGWSLTFSLSGPGQMGWRALQMSLDAYLQVEMEQARHRAALPELFEGPFCAVDRYFAQSLSSLRKPESFLRVVEPMRPQDGDWS